MLKKAIAAAVLATFVAGAAVAGPPKNQTKKAPKGPVCKVCPITGEDVKGDGGGSVVVGKTTYYFCCAGCKPQFEKMTKKNQQTALAKAMKKQKDESKKKA